MKNLTLLLCVLLIYGCGDNNKPIATGPPKAPKIIAEHNFAIPAKLQDRFASVKQDVFKGTLKTTDPASTFQITATRITSTKDTASAYLTKITIEILNECKGCTYQAGINSTPANNSKGAKWTVTGTIATTKSSISVNQSSVISFKVISNGNISEI